MDSRDEAPTMARYEQTEAATVNTATVDLESRSREF